MNGYFGDYFDDDPAAWQGNANNAVLQACDGSAGSAHDYFDDDPAAWQDILADEDGAGRVSDEALDDFVDGAEMPDCF
jgi:hypothetical protein